MTARPSRCTDDESGCGSHSHAPSTSYNWTVDDTVTCIGRYRGGHSAGERDMSKESLDRSGARSGIATTGTGEVPELNDSGEGAER